MSAVQTFGFFAETYGTGQSVEEALASAAHPQAPRIADYLDAGTVILMAPDVATDPQDPFTAMGDHVVRSDGEWAWPGELGALVRSGRVGVPDELIERMQAAGWSAATLDGAAVEATVDAFMATGTLGLVDEGFDGDPFAAEPSEGDAPPEVAALTAGVLPLRDPPSLWDHVEAAGLDPEEVLAKADAAGGALPPDVLDQLRSRLGWHPPDPAVERDVEALLRSFHEVLRGRARAVDPGALSALAARGEDPDFWNWLGGSVAEGQAELALLYTPETLDLLQAVVSERGDLDAITARIGPLRVAGLRASAALVDALEAQDGKGRQP